MAWNTASDRGEIDEPMRPNGDTPGMICQTPGCHARVYQNGAFCWGCLHGEPLRQNIKQYSPARGTRERL